MWVSLLCVRVIILKWVVWLSLVRNVVLRWFKFFFESVMFLVEMGRRRMCWILVGSVGMEFLMLVGVKNGLVLVLLCLGSWV